MKLVIVESPAKCTTIKRYLGDEYEVVASLGHIRDLATSGKGGLGVDVNNDFTPSYIINKDKGAVVSKLISLAKKADEVILATDPDREGEAIAWHLSQVLNLDVETTKRLEFHEITRDSISYAMENPRTINKDLVSSQETRRILDRIIGFKLSTLMNKKIKAKSAGRVQSATLKLIRDLDKEIDEFIPKEYWNILVDIMLNNKEFRLNFSGKNGKSFDIGSKEKADEVLGNLPESLTVKKVEKTFHQKESKEPFRTSTMQQEAFAKLKFKTKKTQFIAQQLYEGMDVGGEHVGLITYMRTDSTRLSSSFIEKTMSYIEETYGKEYVGSVKKYRLNDMTQDAHEAIRPTSCARTPESVRKYLTPDQYNLYKLIYNRAVSSLMKAKKEEVLNVSLDGGEYNFKFDLTHTVFKGYEVLYKDDDAVDYAFSFPNIQIGDIFAVLKKEAEQKFTQAPTHYSEAKLVKVMEEVGIGRPSTYASTIETLCGKTRGYVTNNAGVLTITDLGKKTAIILNKYFPNIIDVKYTAQMEEKLDDIKDGDASRKKILTDFYGPFMEELRIANESIYIDEPEKVGVCPKCGGDLIYKDGKNGKFIGCSNYPKCKYIEKEKKEEPEKTGEKCPICGKDLVLRTDKKGRKFTACSGYPECRYIKAEIAEEGDKKKVCPKCGGYLVKKKGKYGYFYGCSNFPQCDYMEKIYRKKGK